MQTISFYSFKGGVGRTLVLANVARYLARFGKSVFALDFDLEAPGLVYKFALTDEDLPSRVKGGVVDYIVQSVSDRQPPPSLEDYVLDVKEPAALGEIRFMPAGLSPSGGYWRKLASIRWHDLFYGEKPKGVSLFRALQSRIETEYQPDFLLIDSRTGVTEIGGVATTILADIVICLLLNNRENLEGAREVLRSVRRTSRPPGKPPVDLLPVLCRIPVSKKTTVEEDIKAEVRGILNAECDEDLSSTLNVEEIFVLHSEPDLQLRESLRVGGKRRPGESPLLRDYIRLFAQFIPPDTIRPHIASLIEEAKQGIWDNPEGVQENLETLADFAAHPDVYHALLRLYHVRRAEKQQILQTACMLCEVGNPSDSVLWKAVRDNFEEVGPHREGVVRAEQLPLIEGVWHAAGADHVKVGFDLAGSYDNFGEKPDACRILRGLLAQRPRDEKVVCRLLRQLELADQYDAGFELVDQYKGLFAGSTRFLQAWGKLALVSGKTKLLLDDPQFSIDSLSSAEPLLSMRLLRDAGRTNLAEALLEPALREVTHRGQYPSDYLVELGQAFSEMGKRAEFESRLKRSMPDRYVRDILREVEMRR